MWQCGCCRGVMRPLPWCDVQVARVWQRLIQVREAEDGIENFEVIELWREMIRLLLGSVEQQDNETQQHVSYY